MGATPIGHNPETNMPTLSPREATERLIRSVEGMDADDLLDFHNEVFPQDRKSQLDAGADDRRKILDYITRGLEIEEILDFWSVAFPNSYNVHFDDEDRTIHYSELSEAVRSSD